MFKRHADRPPSIGSHCVFAFRGGAHRQPCLTATAEGRGMGGSSGEGCRRGWSHLQSMRHARRKTGPTIERAMRRMPLARLAPLPNITVVFKRSGVAAAEYRSPSGSTRSPPVRLRASHSIPVRLSSQRPAPTAGDPGADVPMNDRWRGLLRRGRTHRQVEVQRAERGIIGHSLECVHARAAERGASQAKAPLRASPCAAHATTQGSMPVCARE